MRSIPAAMTWELLRGGRWIIPANALGTLALPMLVLSSLSSVSSLDPHDESTYILLFLFAQANIFAVVTAMLALTYQSTPQIFLQPATAATLVNGRLLPAAVVLTLDVVCWSALLNVLFRIDWPIWEPALFACATLTAAFAVLWFCYGSHWMIFGFTTVAALFGYWVKSHFGPMFGMPSHAWTPMGLVEGAALAGVSFAFYRLAIAGLARARRGEPALSLGIVAWLNSLPERRVSSATLFASSLAAQRWYFRRQLWIAPVAVLSGSLIGMLIWAFASGDQRELVNGFALGCWCLCIATMLGGVVLGALGSKGDVVLGQFLATRPLSTREMARELLRIAAESCALAWLAWGLVFVVVLSVLLVLGHAPAEMLSKEFTLKFLAAAIIASWGVMSCVMTIALTGRAPLVFRAILAIGAIVVVGMPATKYALTPNAHAWLMSGGAMFVGAGFTVGTIAIFAVALRRRLISPPVLWATIGCWLLMLAIVISATSGSEQLTLAAAFMLYGSLALAVAPLAAAPLALAWNRTR